MSTDWAALSRSEVRDVGVGRVQHELERLGWSVRRSEDARSKLLVARRGAREIEVHVRVVRKLNYTFLTKRSFAPAPDRYVAYVRLPLAAGAQSDPLAGMGVARRAAPQSRLRCRNVE